MMILTLSESFVSKPKLGSKTQSTDWVTIKKTVLWKTLLILSIKGNMTNDKTEW